MKTNLIQSYISNIPQAQQYNSDRAKQNFDVHKELANRTFIKPLPSNGHLVRNTIFDLPAEFFRDVKYDLRALRHSLKGKANDHELGSLNDVGMKLGGLGIATYLFSRKSTPLTKVMEFVGLTSFFMAMDIWPKLSLQLPAYLLHGFDIRQKYVDNFGTKKPVFLDHQFIPWDLYSDKEINKIGDRMGVPKDMNNRRDFIQEKMRKIALQNNTMWMLTSGFATPILSALICNALEKPVNKHQDAYFEGVADNLLNNFKKETEKLENSQYAEKVSKLLEANKDKTVTPELFKKIFTVLTEGLDGASAKAMERDLYRMLYQTEGFDFDSQTVEEIGKALKNEFLKLNLTQAQLNSILPSAEELAEAFNQQLQKAGENVDFSDHTKIIMNLIDSKIEQFAKSGASQDLVEDLKFVSESLPHSKYLLQSPLISKVLRTQYSAKLTQDKVSGLTRIAQALKTYKARLSVLNKYAYIKVAQAPETILANSWNNISEGLLQTFRITDKEIEKARFDREYSAKLLRTKFDEIAGNDDLYREVIEDLQKKLSYLANKTAFGDIDRYSTAPENLYHQKVNVTFDNIIQSLRENGFRATVKHLGGYYNGDPHSAKDMQLAFVTDRIRGVRSSFYRILNTLDMYHRVAKLENIDMAFEGIDIRLVKEEIIEMCKDLLISGHSDDYAVKFYRLIDMGLNPENMTPEQIKEYFSKLEVKDGKLIYKFLGKKPIEELADNPYDKTFYEAAMKLMYKEKLHPDTIEKIKDSPAFFADFEKYRRDLFNAFGGERYFAKPWHKVKDTIGGATSEFKFNILACSPDEMFNKLCSQRYNGNKWLKMFGISASVLFGITVLSQFFMGRMNSDKIKEAK